MERRLLISGLLAVAAAFAQIQTATAQSFPQLGAYFTSGNIDYSALSHVGNLNVAVVTAWPGWSEGGKNLQQEVAAMKVLNANMKITVYTAIMEVPSWEMTSGEALYSFYTGVNSNNWWLRSPYPSGSIVIDTASAHAVNIVSSTSGGQTFDQWASSYLASFTTAVAPNVDGIFTDNYFYQPRVSGDYLQNGTSQSPAAIAQNWRTAYAHYDAAQRTAMGAGYQHWGNVADWASGNSITGYNQLLEGGVIESIIGQSYSWEANGWTYMMQGYAQVMNALKSPKYGIFQQDGSSTDYQGYRYGLASCLLDNGYFFANTSGNGSVGWFDEMGVNLGAAIAGPNNPNNGTYSNGGLTVWQKGVWRRDFANGIALVNPKGNGPQTVTLETTYQHFSGTQAPSVNNGQQVTSVTLNDRDGVILLRVGSQSSQPLVPDAPTLTGVQ